MSDKNTNSTNTTKKTSMFESLIPLIGTAISGITSLFGKNAEVEKAQTELQTAQQTLKIAQEATKQKNGDVQIAALHLAEVKEATAQKAVDDATAITKQKQSIGIITLAVIFLLVFGLAFLFVKFVLPIIFPKPEAQAQNVVIQDN